MILDPVSVSGGVIIPPDGCFKRIREICDKHEVLLILDEVITGYGRTGAAFGGDRIDAIPDIVTVTKNLTISVAHGTHTRALIDLDRFSRRFRKIVSTMKWRTTKLAVHVFNPVTSAARPAIRRYRAGASC